MTKLRNLLSVVALLAAQGVCRPGQAANVCGETVPTNRIIDGFPAYSQCTGSTSSAIYSNNGVETGTTSAGTGWVRTQGSGGYQCTEWAHRYLYFKWNVQSVPTGNAGVWCDGTIPTGLVKATAPVHGDLIVFAPGSCGADPTTGHVAVIDVVNANSTVTFVEQNSAGRRSCASSTAACFLHATANSGASVDAIDGGAPDSSGGGSDVAAGRDAIVGNNADVPRFDTASTGGAGGAVGAGGQAGTVAGAGGSSGSGGVVATGGFVGTGGASDPGTGTNTNSGGSAGTSGPSTTGQPAPISSGCSCRLGHQAFVGSRSGGWLSLIVLTLMAGMVVTIRRRRR